MRNRTVTKLAAEMPPADPNAPAAPADNGDAMKSCAKSCRDAAAACTAAAEQLATCADELEGGTDSLSTLAATDAASDAAVEALEAASATRARLRGEEAPPSSQPGMAAPPAMGAAALPVARAATVAEHIEVARLAKFGRAVMLETGKSDPESALGVVRARFALASEVPGLRKQIAETSDASATAERAKLLQDAVALGVKPAMIWDVAEGDDGKKVKAETSWAKGQSNAELRAFVEQARELGGFGLVGGEKKPEDKPLDAPAAVAGLSPQQLAYCKQRGLDPVKFAAQLPKTTNAPAAAQG